MQEQSQMMQTFLEAVQTDFTWPASMIALTFFPSSDPKAIVVLNMSPVRVTLNAWRSLDVL